MLFPVFAEIFTDGVAFGFTVMVIALLVTLVAVTHDNELVITHVMTSLFVKPVEL